MGDRIWQHQDEHPGEPAKQVSLRSQSICLDTTERTVFSTIDVNSSKLILPSLRVREGSARELAKHKCQLAKRPYPSLSASMIVLSTICCSWAS